MSLEKGSLLNQRYRILEILGQGGMASLYRAIDENLGVDVAVKENLFTTTDYARQFRLEAVILASLRHPNLPRVTDHFVKEGQGQYLVMDFIEGEDLRQRMDRIGGLPENEVIVLGVAICEALIYLHSRIPPVLHRDIKPGNVKITPRGDIYLVDFGLAKVAHRGQATTSGARAMTPGYSPPEQYGSARTDPRTDIYSLGATLYSALTDTLPEDGLARAMDQTQLTPLRQHNSQVSKRLAAVIEKALEVRPDNRYQSAEEMRQALLSARSTTQRNAPIELSLTPPPVDDEEEFDLVSSPIPVMEAGGALPLSLPPSTPLFQASLVQPGRSQPKRWGWRLAAAAFILLFTGGTTSLLYNQPFPLARWSRLLAPATPTLSLTISPTAVGQVEVVAPPATNTPTPQPATYTPFPQPATTNTSPPAQVVAQRPTRMETIPTEMTSLPEPTPLGGSGQIAFASDRSGMPEIWITSLDGSQLTQITEIPEGACQPAWSPDGARLVFISPCKQMQEVYASSSLFLINADGGGLLPLPSMPGGDFDPSWSPDGTKIAFTSLRQQTIPKIYIYDLKTNRVTAVEDPDGKTNSYPAWSPDGSRLAYVGLRGQVWSMSPDGSDRRLLSRVVGNFKNREPSWSPDGQLVMFTQWEEGVSGNPWLAKVDGIEGSLSQALDRNFPMADPSFSPDGFWVVFHGWSAEQNHDLFIINPSGISRRQITSGPANDFDPAWRP